MPAPPQIVVVGAGIIGASIAWHLAASGAAVTVVDAAEPGGIATPASFAWINASFGNPEPYYRLRMRSIAEWRRLAEAVPDIPLAWTGGLCWDLPPAELEAYLRQHSAWNYPIRVVDRAEAARIEPNLADPPAFALHAEGEGAVEPWAAARALLANAKRRGARLLPSTAVTGLVRRDGRTTGIATADGPISADHVVLAAGAGTAELAATAGIRLPMTTPPGLLAHSRPYRKILSGLVIAPALHMRQTADGRIVAGADFGGADPGEDARATAAGLLAKAKAMLRDADDLALDVHTVGYRPTPADGFPVIGRPDCDAGLYLAVLHSGITLAPAVGRFAALELLAGRRDPLLAPYGPERFG
jgi:glycine/D-amino acid oxidase-like deaminating enzyme